MDFLQDMNYLSDAAMNNPSQAAATQIKLRELQNFVNKQKRARGYIVPVQIGTNTFDFQISGSARMLLGIALLMEKDSSATIPAEKFSLYINNETVIEDVDPNFLSYRLNTDEYYFFPRPLNGSDRTSVQITSAGAFNCKMIVYYI